MLDNNIESLEFPLLILYRVGLYSNRNSKLINVTKKLYIISLSFILTMALMQFLRFKADVLEIVETIEGLSAVGQHLAKVIVIVYQHNKLSSLILNVKSFWKTDICTKYIKTKLDNILAANLRLQTIFFGCVVASAFVSVVSPMFGRALPLGVWNFEEYQILYKMTLAAQTVTLPPVAIFLVAFDCMFLAFCIETMVQFRILSECLKYLKASDLPSDGNEEYNKLKIYIEHHVFLYRFLKAFQVVYSPAIVVQYVSIAPLICSEMYVLFERTSTFSKGPGLSSRCGVICFTSILQLALYCIPADYVTTEAVAVSNAVYNSDWYSNFCPSLRKPISFIMQKAQKQFVFTAGGLFEINTRSLLTVLKLSWSWCTVMRAIKLK